MDDLVARVLRGPAVRQAPAARVPDAGATLRAMPETSRDRNPGLRSRQALGGGAAAAAVVCCWVIAVGPSGRLPVSTGWRDGALFAHLAALVIGFGGVIVIDWLGLLWMLGRGTLTEVTRAASGLHPLIWSALAVLVISGALLHPDMSSALTRVKLALVLVIAVNGLFATALQRALDRVGDRPPGGLLVRAASASTVSQASWWATMAIGFANRR
jgi:hypothetical protein